MTESTKWPPCATPGCDGRIYLRPDIRKVCGACEMKGLAPVTVLPLPAPKEPVTPS